MTLVVLSETTLTSGSRFSLPRMSAFYPLPFRKTLSVALSSSKYNQNLIITFDLYEYH